jgi:predicted nucleic acid-binding protein
LTAHTVAVDTSVAVPMVLGSHTHHHSVTEALTGRVLRLSGHAVVETYAVLTRLPGDARLALADAVRVIDSNFGGPVLLPPGDAADLHRRLAAAAIAGGATYDAIIGLAAQAADLTLVTRDSRAAMTYRALGVAVEVIGSR